MSAKVSGWTALLPLRFSLTRGRADDAPRQPWSGWLQAALRLPLGAKPVAPRERLEVVDRLPLGGKKSLLLISLGGQRLLVGVGEQGAISVQTLAQRKLRASHAQGSPAYSMSRARRIRRTRKSQ